MTLAAMTADVSGLITEEANRRHQRKPKLAAFLVLGSALLIAGCQTDKPESMFRVERAQGSDWRQ